MQIGRRRLSLFQTHPSLFPRRLDPKRCSGVSAETIFGVAAQPAPNASLLRQLHRCQAWDYCTVEPLLNPPKVAMANAKDDASAAINTAAVPPSDQQSAVPAASTATYDFANTTNITPSATRRTSIASVGMNNESSSTSQPPPPSDAAAAASTTASASLQSSQVSESNARRPRIKDYGETAR